MEFVEFMPDGGTVISSAMEWAVSVAKSKDDVIILSDGEILLTDDEIQMYRSQLPGSSILGVLIGYANDEVMAKLCDKMISTDDLLGSANDLFRFVQ
jgi:aspartate ammonia-lyase